MENAEEKEDNVFQQIKNLKPEQKKGFKNLFSSLLISLIIILIVGIILYFKLSPILSPNEIAQFKSILSGLGLWGILGIIGAIVFYLTGIFLFIRYRDKYKEGSITIGIHKIILDILVCSVCALFVTWNLFNADTMQFNFYVFILAFGLSYMFFQLFKLIKIENFNKITHFPLAFIFRFCIPMMFVVLILLGAVQGLYPSNSTFLQDIARVFGTDKYISISDGGSVGTIIGFGCYKLVSTLYLMGEARPVFMLALCVLITLILFYYTLYKHFVKCAPPLSFVDDLSEDEIKKLENQDESEELDKSEPKSL